MFWYQNNVHSDIVATVNAVLKRTFTNILLLVLYEIIEKEIYIFSQNLVVEQHESRTHVQRSKL